MADVIFKSIKNYGYMHSSQFLHLAITEATKLGLASAGEFLESRMIKPFHCFESSSQYSIRSDRLKSTPSMGKFGLTVTNVWDSEQKIKNDLFESEGALHPMKLAYLDIPYLHTNNVLGMKFI